MVVSYQSSCFLWKERKVIAEKRRDKKGRILRKGVNLAITMKVYNHVDDKRMRDEIEKFDAKRDGKEKVS